MGKLAVVNFFSEVSEIACKAHEIQVKTDKQSIVKKN
jgi:hypothetical protein